MISDVCSSTLDQVQRYRREYDYYGMEAELDILEMVLKTIGSKLDKVPIYGNIEQTLREPGHIYVNKSDK